MRNISWPVAGITLGAVAAGLATGIQIPALVATITAFAEIILVLILASHPVGLRISALLSGMLMAVPCYIQTSALERFLLMVFMAIPFAAAAALVVAPPISGIRARLAYLLNWCGSSQVTRRARQLDTTSLRDLLLSTAVLAAAIAVIPAPTPNPARLILRWFAGGIATHAFAEMLSSCLPLVASVLGVQVPPLMRSPYRARTLTEFWAKRWNCCASEKLFHRLCFAPLARRGVAIALFITFAASAIAHFLLALMALGDLGLALACGTFFLVQPLFIAVERLMHVRRWTPAASHAWTITVLALSSPLFVEPILQIFGIGGNPLREVPTLTALALALVVVFCSLLAGASLISCPTTSAQQINKI